MTHAQAEKQRMIALRNSQLDLYHRLQETLNEVSGEMLGTKDWRTDQVDRSLRELLDEINDHFGMEEEEED